MRRHLPVLRSLVTKKKFKKKIGFGSPQFSNTCSSSSSSKESKERAAMAMDYNQAALKLLCVQLKDAVDSPHDNAINLRGILFQRAWLQGVLVSADGDRLFLDDGTALIQLHLSSSFPRRLSWTVGMYVMAIGRYIVGTTESPMIQIHKMVDLSDSPDREAMWYLEVLEAYKLFYKPVMEEMLHD